MEGEAKRGLSASWLKYFACFSMLVDHVAALFCAFDSPYWVFLRGFGRLAFPIFAIFLAEGCRKTHSLPDYAKRLFLFALVAQIPFMLLIGGVGGSVILTFFLAVAGITIYEDWHERYPALVAMLPALCMLPMAHWLNVDYGYMGIILIFCLYLCKENRPAKYTVLLLWLFFLYQDLFAVFGSLAVLLLLSYNGQRGKGSKWFFYWFYPLHLLVLYLIYYVRYLL